MAAMEARGQGGSDPDYRTGAGVMAALTTRSSTRFTTVGPRACRRLAAHWARKASGPWSLTSNRCPCRRMSRRSRGKSHELRGSGSPLMRTLYCGGLYGFAGGLRALLLSALDIELLTSDERRETTQ